MPKSFIKCEAFYNSIPTQEIKAMLERGEKHRVIFEQLGLKNMKQVQLVSQRFGIYKHKKKLSVETGEVIFKRSNVDSDSFILNSF